MLIERIIHDLESTLADIKRTRTKMEVMQQALGFFDRQFDSTWTASDGAYHYIPLDLGDFISSLNEVDEFLRADPAYKHKGLPYRPVHYLEIGCGIGRNVFVAKHGRALQFASVTGIDVAPSYIAQAKRFFFLSDQEVQIADAMQFDFSRYDVVYFYRLFADEPLEARFERRLIRLLRPGAYIVAHLHSMLDKSRLLQPKGDSSRIYQKKLPKASR